MSTIEIRETEKVGEQRWGILLIDETDNSILRNVNPLASGVALSAAKAIKNKGPDAVILTGQADKTNRPAWIVEDQTADGWLVKFTLVEHTLFVLHAKFEQEDTLDAVEKGLEIVRNCLRKAEIKWHPPQADPAYDAKETDTTETQGFPGS